MAQKVVVWVDEVLHQTGKALKCKVGNDEEIWFPNYAISDIWKDNTLFPEGPLDEDLLFETDVCIKVDRRFVDEQGISEENLVEEGAYGG